MSALVAMLSLVALQSGGWAIAPGHERVFSRVTAPAQGELPDDWGRRAIAVPKDRVEVLYGPRSAPAPSACAEAPLCVTLMHPELAPASAPLAGPFAIVVSTQGERLSVDALVAGIRARILEAKPPSPFKAVKVKLPEVLPVSDAEVVDATEAPGGALAGRFRAMLKGDPELHGRVLRVEVSPERVCYVLRADSGDPAEALVELRNRSPRQSDPREVTRSFYVRGIGGVSDPPDLARRVHAALLVEDDGSLRLKAADVMATGERPPIHTALIVLTLLTLLGLLAGLWPLGRHCYLALREQRLALGLLCLGALARLLVEGRLVEMGIGYQLTRYADELLLPRYGAGTTTLHHLVFQLFGADHDVMIWTHRVLGILTLPLAFVSGVALLSRGAPLNRWCTAGWAGALALTPMLVKSDATESNLVPVLFGLWVALLAWQRLRGAFGALVTLSGLTFVALSRPEMAVVGPGIWLALMLPWRRPKEAALVLVPLLGAVAVQLVFIQQVIDWEMGVQSLHLGKSLSAERVLDVALNNALWDPRLVPLGLAPLALCGLAVKDLRAPVVTLMLGGLLWVYVYAVDLSAASMPRLHIVIVLAWSLPGAVGLGWLATRHRALGLVALGLWSLSAMATIPTLWAPTNEDTQKRLFERAAASLPDTGGYVLGALASSDAPDPPGHFTHRHVPTYLFDAGMIAALGELDRWVGGEQPVYYFQGTSCYARLLRSETTERGLLPPCAALHRAYKLEAVWTERVPSHGNPVHQELGYYGDDAHFDVGLWRVVGRADTVTK